MECIYPKWSGTYTKLNFLTVNDILDRRIILRKEKKNICVL